MRGVADGNYATQTPINKGNYTVIHVPRVAGRVRPRSMHWLSHMFTFVHYSHDMAGCGPVCSGAVSAGGVKMSAKTVSHGREVLVLKGAQSRLDDQTGGE